MKKYIIVLLLTCLLLVSGCSRNPVTGENNLNFYSEADEIKMGADYHPQIVAQYGEYKDEKLQKYVQDMVNRLGDVSHRPNLTYPVTVLDTPQVNAFALPGGHVYVCRGILKYFNSEAELAGVMAHEIGHVCARHGVEQLSRSQGFNLGLFLGSLLLRDDQTKADSVLVIGGIASVLSGLSYSRENEMQADRLGIEYTQKSGYSPLGVGRVMTMFQRMQGGNSGDSLLSILSTHPASDLRAKQARIEIRKLQEEQKINENLERTRYLAMTEGIVTGYNPARGIIKNNTYYNTATKLTTPITAGFKTYIEEVGLFLAQQNDAQTIIYTLHETGKNTPELLADLYQKELKVAPAQVSTLAWNNNSGKAYGYVLPGAAENQYKKTTQYLVYYGDKILELKAIETSTNPTPNTTIIANALNTLKTLTPAEAAQIQPEYLKIYTVVAGDTWQSVTTKHFPGKEAKLLAWLNDRELNEPLPEKIKLALF